jgi:multisubunit Na+/H+ antiporter MnhE subunit
VNRRTTLLGVAEVLAWWALLALLWLVFIRAVDPRELVMGALAALIGAFAAWGTRRAVSGW